MIKKASRKGLHLCGVKPGWRTVLLLAAVAGVSSLLASCGESHTPKPRGYFRIELPEKEYVRFDSAYPYRFDLPTYSVFRPDTKATAEPYWADVEFPAFRGTLHLSYKTIRERDDLLNYMEDARSFVHQHIPKATGIREEILGDPENMVYGIYYEIRGRESASPVQFFLTDSTTHFLRGALYFQVTPNNDSLAPVIQFIEQDIRQMIRSLQWNDQP
jgi:gliding motility-associated lipoprotein GldD